MTTQIRIHFHDSAKTLFFPLLTETTNRAGETVGYVCKTGGEHSQASEWFPRESKSVSSSAVNHNK